MTLGWILLGVAAFVIGFMIIAPTFNLFGFHWGNGNAQEKDPKLKCIIFNDGTTAVVQTIVDIPGSGFRAFNFCDGHGESIAYFVKHGYVINSSNYWEVIMTR